MKIKVKYFGMIQTILGGKREEIVDISRSTTIKQLIHSLSGRHGEEFRHHCFEKQWNRIRDNIFVSVDGERIVRIQENDQATLEGKKEIMLLSITYTRGG